MRVHRAPESTSVKYRKYADLLCLRTDDLKQTWSGSGGNCPLRVRGVGGSDCRLSLCGGRGCNHARRPRAMRRLAIAVRLLAGWQCRVRTRDVAVPCRSFATCGKRDWTRHWQQAGLRSYSWRLLSSSAAAAATDRVLSALCEAARGVSLR